MSNRIFGQIERERALRKARRGVGVYKQDASGKTMEKKSSASSVVSCPGCRAMVVCSRRAIRQHYQRIPSCLGMLDSISPSK